MTESGNSTKDIFDSWAGQERGQSMAHNHEELFHAMISGWTHQTGKKILDIACGNGFALRLLKSQGYSNLCGIDFSGNMIREAGQHLPGAELVVGSMEDLPWPDGTFDRVYSIEALYYSKNPEKAAREMKRVLKPDGTVDIVIEYYGENKGSHSWEEALGTELALLTSVEWSDLFTRAGFNNVSTSRIVRKGMRSESEFTPDPYYPSYDLYREFKRQGALHIRNYWPEQ